jgi:hypothetical protein
MRFFCFRIKAMGQAPLLVERPYISSNHHHDNGLKPHCWLPLHPICSLFIVHCSLFTVHYSPFIIHYSLFTVHCSLFIIHFPPRFLKKNLFLIENLCLFSPNLTEIPTAKFLTNFLLIISI